MPNLCLSASRPAFEDTSPTGHKSSPPALQPCSRPAFRLSTLQPSSLPAPQPPAFHPRSHLCCGAPPRPPTLRIPAFQRPAFQPSGSSPPAFQPPVFQPPIFPPPACHPSCSLPASSFPAFWCSSLPALQYSNVPALQLSGQNQWYTQNVTKFLGCSFKNLHLSSCPPAFFKPSGMERVLICIPTTLGEEGWKLKLAILEDWELRAGAGCRRKGNRSFFPDVFILGGPSTLLDLVI